MACWTIRSAKARFGELLDAAIKDGPRFVTRRGVQIAVLVTIEEWRRLQRTARPGMKRYVTCSSCSEFPPRRRLRGIQGSPTSRA